MKTNVKYVVTKESNNGTLRVGDHIWMDEDGDLFCVEAQGWLYNADATKALEGVEYVVDMKWVERERSKCWGRLNFLKDAEIEAKKSVCSNCDLVPMGDYCIDCKYHQEVGEIE